MMQGLQSKFDSLIATHVLKKCLLLLKPMVRHLVHKIPLWNPVLSQLDVVRTLFATHLFQQLQCIYLGLRKGLFP
jgi:hypothetical protein